MRESCLPALVAILLVVGCLGQAPAVTLLSENFEGVTFPPTGWTQSYKTSTQSWARQNGDYGEAGGANGTSYDAYLFSTSTATHETYLITPAINFGTNTGNPTLEFWHKQRPWGTDQDTLTVYYKTSSGGTWTQIATYTSAVSTWTERTLSLPSPGSTYYIGFLGNAKYGYGVCVDEVVVSGDSSSGPTTFYSQPLNSSPGWTVQGQWAFGTPSGGGGVAHPSPDPTSGHTGSNVYGVNLSGDYSTAAGGPWYLKTGALSCTGYTGVHLKFWRWLNCDSGAYVPRMVEVSNNGTTWENKFTSSETMTATSWTQYDYDISAVADNQATVYVRWGYQVKANAYATSGWNIDDIELSGVAATGTCAIAGRLTYAGSGAAVVGATVTLTPGSVTATTNSTGDYSFMGLPVGTYTVTPRLTGADFTPAFRTFTNLSGAVTGVDFVASYSVSGRVTRASDGLPMAGVTVSATLAGGSTTTAGDGTYTLTGLAPSTYTITASCTGYTFSPSSMVLTFGPNASGVNFTGSEATSTLTAYLTYNNWSGNMGTGKYEMIAGVYTGLDLGSWKFWLDFAPDGTLYAVYGESLSIMNTTTGDITDWLFLPIPAYGFTVAPDGTGYINGQYWDAGYHPNLWSVNLTTGACTFLGPVPSAPAFNAIEYANGYLYGLSMDTWELYEVDVGALNATLVGSVPSYSYGDLDYGPDGVMRVVADQTLYRVDLATAALTTEVGTISAPAGLYGLALQAGPSTYSISGQVLTPGGAAMSGVTVTKTPSGETTTTDGAGSYTFTDVSAGTYTITPSQTGYAFNPDDRSVEVSADVTGVNFVGTAVTHIIINEVDPGSADAVELFNRGLVDLPLTGWKLLADGAEVYTLPAFTLGVEDFVVIHAGSGTNTATDLYTGGALPWSHTTAGACGLTDETGYGVDFVRWAGSTVSPPSPTLWYAGSDPAGGSEPATLGRIYKVWDWRCDTDNGWDWSWQSNTLGAANNPGPPPPVMVEEPQWTPGDSNTVSWSSVGTADHYWVQWSLNPAFDPVWGGNTTSDTSYLVTSLPDGALVYYRVSAWNGYGGSAWSNVVSSTQDALAPQSHVNALSSPQLTASFTVSWTAFDAVSGVNHVLLMYRCNGGEWNQFGGDLTGGSVTFTWPDGDGMYEFYTLATDNVGQQEPAKTVPDAGTQVDAHAPVSQVWPLPAVITTDAFEVDYTASDGGGSGVTATRLYWRSRPYGTVEWGPWLLYFEYIWRPAELRASWLAGPAEYEFCTSARDYVGHQEDLPPRGDAYTAIVVLGSPTMSPEPPSTPGTENTVFWSPATDALLHRAQCSTTSDFSADVTTTDWGPDLTHNFTGLTVGTTYYYRAQGGAQVSQPPVLLTQTEKADFDGDDRVDVDTEASPDDVVLAGMGAVHCLLYAPPESSSPPSVEPGFVAELQSLCASVTHTATFPADLSPYNLIVLLGPTPLAGLDPVSSAALDAFTSAGGGLIISEAALATGTINTGAVSCPASAFTADWSSREGTTVVDVASPLAAGLATTSALTGATLVPTLKARASVALTWTSDGRPMSVTYANGAGKIVFLNDIPWWYATGGATWDGDHAYGLALLANAVSYALGATEGYEPSGTLTWGPITPADKRRWGVLTYAVQEPAGTNVQVDVLDGTTLAVLASDVPSGFDLWAAGITVPSIKLRATLTTTDTAATPKLSEWAVDHELATPTVVEGPWSSSVWSRQGEPDPTVISIDPNVGENDETALPVTIVGTGFLTGATVTLSKAGFGPIAATDVVVVSDTTITCTLNLSRQPAGLRDVVVRNTDGGVGTLADGFTVQADLSAPQALSWESLKTHANGVEVIALPVLDGFVESRYQGLGTLRVTCNEPLDPATVVAGAVTVTAVYTGDCSGQVALTTLDATNVVLTITFSPPLASQDTYLIQLSPTITDPAGNALEGQLHHKLSVLEGSVNGDRRVDIGDLTRLRSASIWGQPVTPATAPADINGDGRINIGDLTRLRSASIWGKNAPLPLPEWP